MGVRWALYCLRGGPGLQNFVAIAALALPLLLKLLLLCLVAKRLGPATAISPHCLNFFRKPETAICTKPYGNILNQAWYVPERQIERLVNTLKPEVLVIMGPVPRGGGDATQSRKRKKTKGGRRC